MGPLLDSLHFLSAGAVRFARGLNDAPKIPALLLGAQAALAVNGTDSRWSLAFVAVAMAFEGVVSARRVAVTMSRTIARLNPSQGLTANLITAILVAGSIGITSFNNARFNWIAFRDRLG